MKWVSNLYSYLLDYDKKYKSEVVKIAVDLPEYFNENGIKKLKEDILTQDVYIITDLDIVVGFAIILMKNENVSELSWLAVDKERQGQKVGTNLLKYLTKELFDKEIKVLEVKTLSEIIEYEPYRKTREFYTKQGFFLLETIDPYEDFGPGNPCAIYIKLINYKEESLRR